MSRSGGYDQRPPCQQCKARDERIAKLEAVVDAGLTPGQIQGMADHLKLKGDLDSNAVCLTAMILDSKAEDLRTALAALDSEQVTCQTEAEKCGCNGHGCDQCR